MSGKLMGRVFEKDLGDDKKRARSKLSVLLALADHGNDDGTDRIWPSTGRIAWKTGLSRRHVQRLLKELREDKVLVPQGWSDTGSVSYKMDLNVLPDKPKFQPRKPFGDTKGGDISKALGDDIAMSLGDDIAKALGDDITVSPEPSVTVNEPSYKRKGSPEHKSGDSEKSMTSISPADDQEVSPPDVKADTPPDAKADTPLLAAANGKFPDDFDLAEYLIPQGAKVSGWCPVHEELLLDGDDCWNCDDEAIPVRPTKEPPGWSTVAEIEEAAGE